LATLPTISNNGISGIWSPALDNTQTTTYTFTPDTGQTCAQQRTLEIVVNPILTAVFDAVRPICEGEVLNSSSLPQVSNNGIIGTWSPVLNNSQTTIYTFTPAASECATITTLEILVSPRETPIFDTIEPICSGDFLADLQAESNNGITGVWSPALNNTATTVYTFSPNIGVCATTATLEVIVNPIESPIFDTIDPICSGETLIVLPTISNNGITGVWSPALDNTQTTTYTFVPSANQCADTITLEIVVNPILTAVFDAVAPICSGETLTALPTKSNNGITGSWSPALDNTQTTIYTFAPLGSQCANLVTLEIIVNPIIIPLFDSVDLICNDESLAALPTISNNGISGIWSPVLDNTQTTTYTFTPDVGQGCLVEVTLEIVVDIPITPTFSIANSICEGDDLEDLPMISNEGIVGVWTPQLNNLATTTYTFIPDTGQCAEEVSQEIVVISISELSVTVEVASQSFNDNQIVVASVTGGTGLYEYQLDYGPWKESNIFRGIRGCEDHIIRVREIAGCSNIAIEAFQILDYPKYFTPNGDANNDRWNIKCLEDQGGARITIFNRYGKLLAVINPSSSGWDGIYNNAIMPTADYWFKAEYFDENGSPIVFASHFTLKR
jgi:gliding motility-associated-like protein